MTKPRDRESVQSLTEGLRNYRIDRRGDKFVVVCMWNENRFNSAKRKRENVQCEEDASEPGTESEALARLDRLRRFS